MIEKWYSTFKLPLTFEQFERLPQNRAYKYEYCDGHAWLTPRPQSYHAVLDLGSFVRPIDSMGTEEELRIHLLTDEDWDQLPPLFAAAFHRVQPFASLTDGVRLQAAQECLRGTKEGTEGPLIPPASLVAMRKSDAALVGALLTTLAPNGDPALALVAVEDASSARCHRAADRTASFDVGLRRPLACSFRSGNRFARRDCASTYPTGIFATGQHVSPGQRIQHSMALASRFPPIALPRLHAVDPAADAPEESLKP